MIVMVSLAPNAVTSMDPSPGMENTLSTMALPAIIKPKLCASMVIGGSANRLTRLAIFHSDTPRAPWHTGQNRCCTHPEVRIENTDVAGGHRNSQRQGRKNEILQAVRSHNAENRNINREGEQKHEADPIIRQRHTDDAEQVDLRSAKPPFLLADSTPSGILSRVAKKSAIAAITRVGRMDADSSSTIGRPVL